MLRFGKLTLVCVALALGPVQVAAQEEAGFTWSNSTELSFVSTSGNASATTLGVKGRLDGDGGENVIQVEVGGVRASSDVTTRRAVGTPEDFTVVESVRSETTAESYFARSRYDREFGRGFAFGGLGWDRNTFAGVQNRFAIVGGLGRTFVEGDAGRLKADLGLTYTIQNDVAPAPGADETFGGWRASLDAVRALTETSEIRSQLVVDNSLEDTGDLRADLVTSLSASINARFALKTSVQVLWDNTPALVSAPLETAGGVPTGVEVLTPGAQVDSVVTVALVIQL